MTHDGELCASLPMTQVGIAAWYCHVHQGWCWTTHIYRQGADDDIDVLHAHDGDLGPFDDPAELVARWSALLDEARGHIASGTV